MEKITAYKSRDGKIYTSQKECELADKKFDNLNPEQKILEDMGRLFAELYDDGKWHCIDKNCHGHKVFVRSKTPYKSTAFEIAVEIDGGKLTLVNSTYYKDMIGFCHGNLRQYLDTEFWADPYIWLRKAVKTKINAIDQQIKECKEIREKALEVSKKIPAEK